ncbi:hypothetical protein GEMRC1_003518 [Eukaryota sp. GEM-RC1]
MKILLLVVFALALASACNFSCFHSSCRISGGTGENCQCTTFHGRHHALCSASGATSCEKTDGESGCSIQGNNAKCTLSPRSGGLSTWYISDCQASNANRCTQKVFDYNCAVVGENVKCSTDFVSYGWTTWIVPTCKADRAMQCSIKCGISSCDRNCTRTGQRADCHCYATPTGFLSAKCNCV